MRRGMDRMDRIRASQREVLAGTRDASWFDCPGTWRLPRYHLVADGHRPACGAPTLLSEFSYTSAIDIEPAQRCRRAGCRKAWPARSTK